MRRRLRASLVAGLALLTGGPAMAVDFSLSGFGTIGYAASDRPYTYQRFIDDHGTFSRDSVAGVQVDARIEGGLSATLQLKAAPSTSSDSRYQASVSWAFVSYRPDNDWLFRVGKQRIPLYLNSENYDVGVTYDFARLPTEMYSLVSSNDALGASFTRTWKLRGGELALDGVVGRQTNDIRYWERDDIPGVQARGAVFPKLKYKGGGLFLSYKDDDRTFRVGVLKALLEAGGDGQFQLLAQYPFVPIAPGVGYFQASPLLPGPGLPVVHELNSTTLTLGADVGLPADFRIVGEFARSLAPGSLLAAEGNRGYVALLKRIGKWTPYASYAFLRSTSRSINFYNAINGNRVPPFVPDATLINASQRAAADTVFAYDQHSLALGGSYSFSATSKIKAEVMRTWVGAVSNLVDAPAGGESGHQRINVFSLSYSVVF